jgi:hypothetical protein
VYSLIDSSALTVSDRIPQVSQEPSSVGRSNQNESTIALSQEQLFIEMEISHFSRKITNFQAYIHTTEMNIEQLV